MYYTHICWLACAAHFVISWLSGSKIIDNDFNQESTIEISTLPNKDLIKLIKSGFEEKDVLKISKTSYQLKDSQKPILIRDIADNSFSLIYLDNLDVLNTIIFMVKV